MGILLIVILAGFLLYVLEKPLRLFAAKLFTRPFKGQVFDSQYIDSKMYYMNRFGKVPCISIVDDVDLNKAYTHIRAEYADMITDVYQLNDYNRDKGIQEFRKNFFVLNNEVLVELNYDMVQIFFGNRNYTFANQLVNEVKEFLLQPKKEDFEINIITRGYESLELKQLDIKPTKLDIDLYYNDDFKPVDELIRKDSLQRTTKALSCFMVCPEQERPLTCVT